VTSKAKALIPGDRRLLKWSLFVAVLAIALAIDLVTKHMADSRLVMGESHDVLPFLSLQLTQNNGVAFGMLGGSTALIVTANIFALLVLVAYVLLEKRPVLAGLAGGAIVGGSLGNMIQRMGGDGHVTDFLKFPHWPNFNAADIFIDVGLAAVLIGLVVELVKTWRAKKSAGAPSG
jgi:signal peptidase II